MENIGYTHLLEEDLIAISGCIGRKKGGEQGWPQGPL